MKVSRLTSVALLLCVSICCMGALTCIGDVSVASKYKRYSSGAYFREWKGACLSIRALWLTNEFKVAQELTNEGVRKISKEKWKALMLGANPDSLVSLKVRIEPLEKCTDTNYAHATDIVFGFGRSDAERSQEITAYNFKISERVWLIINGVKVHPEFGHAENSFGMDNGRDLWFGFKSRSLSRAIGKNGTLCLFVQDPVPGMGVAVLEWPAELVRKLI